MTLSNIFIGKRVVQQAFLNDALMYQSNGWQQLPTTPQEMWTKNILSPVTYDNFSGNVYSAIDLNDNILMLIFNTLIKFNSEGSILCKNTFSSSTQPYYDLAIDSEGNIWCSNTYGVCKLDSSGNKLYEFNPSTFNKMNYCKGFVLYNNIIFVGVCDSDNDHLEIFAIDAVQNKILKTSNDIHISNNTSAFFFSMGTDRIYINVDGKILNYNFTTNVLVDTNKTFTFATLDKYNNLYSADSSSLTKYNSDFTQLWSVKLSPLISTRYDVHGTCLSSNVDNAIYVTRYLLNTSEPINKPQIQVDRVETDGTLSWSETFDTDYYNYTENIVAAVDKYGNIYVPVYRNNAVEVHKLINLAKEKTYGRRK